MNDTPNIAVKIMEAELIEFCFDGIYYFENQDIALSGQFKAVISNNMLVLLQNDEFFVSNSPMIFSPSDYQKSNFELKNVTIGIDFHWEKRENQHFPGKLKLLLHENKILAINILDTETYLKYVISSEMSSQSSSELLKAHAVISRSWLFAQIEKQKLIEESKPQNFINTDTEYIRWYDREDHQLFDVCADDHCQRYQGITRGQNPNVTDAVDATTGLVLKNNGQICDTRYSKCCGGATESFENVWEPVNHAYLQKVIDSENNKGLEIDLKTEKNSEKWIKEKPEAFCNTSDKEILMQVLNDYDQSSKDFYRWKVEYSQAELSELVKKKSGIDFGEIIDLIPIERGVSGRLIKLKIVGTKKTLIVGKELEIRRWLSNSHLYSSAFIISKENPVKNIPQKFVIEGAGWGHGVGLCQIGAAVMGHKGYSFNDILAHYFKNTVLFKMY
jgi:stage II sporulation protein D